MYGLVRVAEGVGAVDKDKFCCVRWAPEVVPMVMRPDIGSLQVRSRRLAAGGRWPLPSHPPFSQTSLPTKEQFYSDR